MELKLEGCVANFLGPASGCAGEVRAVCTCVTCSQLCISVVRPFGGPFHSWHFLHNHTQSFFESAFLFLLHDARGHRCNRHSTLQMCHEESPHHSVWCTVHAQCALLCGSLTCLQAKPQGACALGWHCGGTTPVHTLTCYQPTTKRWWLAPRCRHKCISLMVLHPCSAKHGPKAVLKWAAGNMYRQKLHDDQQRCNMQFCISDRMESRWVGIDCDKPRWPALSLCPWRTKGSSPMKTV